MKTSSAAALLAALLMCGSACWAVQAQTPAVSPHNVPEPKGLYDGAMHGYTPDHITGGTVVDSAELAKLVNRNHPVLLDVAEQDRKPPTMSKDTPWLPIHRSIPGAVFLQGGGSGTSDPAFAKAFAARVAELTDGDKGKEVVTFCHPDCWGSYNAAKRLIQLGYTHVLWDREGVEGWQVAYPLATIRPDATWMASQPATTQ